MPTNLNGIPCSNKYFDGDFLVFTLYNTTISDISQLESTMLSMRDSNGTPFEYYGGYSLKAVDVNNNGQYVVKFSKKYTGNQDDKIDALSENFELLKQDYTLKMNEPSPIVANYMSVSMPLISPTIKDTAAASFSLYFPEWKANQSYKKGEMLTYDGKKFRVSQDHDSQEQWKPGSEGMEALYYEIVIASDGIIVWKQPKGEYDSPDKGDKRHYPDAESPVYISKIDANAYSPDSYPDGWELYTEE